MRSVGGGLKRSDRINTRHQPSENDVRNNLWRPVMHAHRGGTQSGNDSSAQPDYRKRRARRPAVATPRSLPPPRCTTADTIAADAEGAAAFSNLLRGERVGDARTTEENRTQKAVPPSPSSLPLQVKLQRNNKAKKQKKITIQAVSFQLNLTSNKFMSSVANANAAEEKKSGRISGSAGCPSEQSIRNSSSSTLWSASRHCINKYLLGPRKCAGR